MGVNRPFTVRSIHGRNTVSEKCIVNIFGENTYFFILDNIPTFDAIIGLDLLRQIGANIDLTRGQIKFNSNTEKIKFLQCENVNHIKLAKQDIPENIREEFEQIMEKNSKVFADPRESLPYNTKIKGTIRTNTNDAIYSKSYPYPMGVSDFVNKEIEDLLKNKIIRPSRSPYNSPIWVVDKKGLDDEGNRKKRLVIDFQKLNAVTIDDKYPIPNISVILSNLGEAKYFTTLDLKSGFHQIELLENDREKTAFSVNNGKYEFCRLPFGLKNAPSIFQRAIDDVLRDQIGKSCHVYIDDVIIYSRTENEHIAHVDWVLRKLLQANMRVSAEKSKFFKSNVEFLGFVVSRGGIRTSPSKIETIRNYPQPSNLFQLRSFLGLTNYYRCFIKSFAKIAKPLTDELKGDNGKVSASQSKKVPINFNGEQVHTFNKLKDILISEDVMLMYPNFRKPFDLTTDASAQGLGAVLSQEGKPLQFISRTLTHAETNYATNERELLAIVWALKTLRHYLYGVKDLKIFTDHQPLTFAVSDKNPNAKLKRWKAFVDEHNAKIFYKPGRENVVADALSRQQLNITEQQHSDQATIHSEISLSNTIPSTDKPMNCYRNQIVIEEAEHPSSRTLIIFGKKMRHILQFSNRQNLFEMVEKVINPSVVNAIHCTLPTLAILQHDLVRKFQGTKFWHCRLFVIDIFDPNDQKEILLVEHNRAHRAAQENSKQIIKEYYFPRMDRIAKEIVSNCKTCSRAKYQRHPRHHVIEETQIPTYAGEILHVDIYSTDKKYFLTCVDKFSKFAIVQPIQSRTIVDIKIPILQLINFYSGTKTIFCDNEKSLNSETITTILQTADIRIVNAPPLHSTSNGQVERFHSTLSEIARCLKIDRDISDTVELILQANVEYNRTIHSVTGRTPLEVIHTTPLELRDFIRERLINAQTNLLSTHNRDRIDRQFKVGDKVFVKSNKRLGNKLSPLYEEGIVEADLGTTILIKGRVVHKDNLR